MGYKRRGRTDVQKASSVVTARDSSKTHGSALGLTVLRSRSARSVPFQDRPPGLQASPPLSKRSVPPWPPPRFLPFPPCPSKSRGGPPPCLCPGSGSGLQAVKRASGWRPSCECGSLSSGNPCRTPLPGSGNPLRTPLPRSGNPR